MKIHKFLIMVLLCCAEATLHAQNNEIVIQAHKPGALIQPTMYGIFLEDINYGVDGGLYAELIKNRSFDFPQPFMGWKTLGNVTLQNDGPFPNNPHYARLGYSGHEKRHTVIENEGYFGIGIKKDEEYRLSLWARRAPKNTPDTIRLEMIHSGNGMFVKEDLLIDSPEWKQYELVFKSPRSDAKCKLRLFLGSHGTVDLEHVSLFPVSTWNGDKNGMRKDLAQLLADLHPGVFRFPGGCIVEGHSLDTRYDWKKSIGPVENRPLNENRWQHSGRLSPDYFQTYGIGFFEYFRFAEEIGAEPLPIISCGLACQFVNVGHTKGIVPMDKLDPYIQDALDLIEFANGDVHTKWGKIRAEMGHPQPFHLKYLGVGNEQWGPEYVERLEAFQEVIRKTYPDIRIVGSSGPHPDDEKFDYLWPEMKRLKVDLVDEHFYRPYDWFLKEATRYDRYDRKGPKVFAGEYACHKTNQFDAAIAEAALMTGMERNADVVHMTAYAPLFAHREGWQWTPDLIWFDNVSYYPTCSYYVQKMYANHPGTHVLPLSMDKKAVTGAEGQNGLYASAVWDKNENSYILKIVNTSPQAQNVTFTLNGLKKEEKNRKAFCTTLSTQGDVKGNSFETPSAITPKESELELNGNSFQVTLTPNSFSLYKIVSGSQYP